MANEKRRENALYANKTGKGRQRHTRVPAAKVAEYLEKQHSYRMKIDRSVLSGATAGARRIYNLRDTLTQIKNPVDEAGRPVEVHTKENYKIYNCLKNMPHCIKSMEITRGDKDGEIGTNSPLADTICVAVHHLDDKTYGGMCVLREWGATEMMSVFVGYNPLQTMIWRKMVDDIPDEKFTACILASTVASASEPSWAEGIYKVAEEFNKFPKDRPLPSDAFNKIFDGTDTTKNPSGSPLPFLNAQRSLCAYNFLQALARSVRNNKKVFVWEDGGYLNPIIDEAIEEKLTVSEFRGKYMVPEDEETDAVLQDKLTEHLKNYFIGSVELTRNGYDMSAAIAEKRKMNTVFFSIAASYEKVMLEGDSITLSCIDAMSQVLYSTGYGLRDRNVLVMGARGNLGRLSVGHLTNLLEDSNKQLWGCDLKVDWPAPDPDTIPEWTRWSASDVPLDGVAGEVSEFSKIPDKDRYDIDVILGWTGGAKTVGETTYHTITGDDVAKWLTVGTAKANLYLVSGSTKTIEFSEVLTWLEGLLKAEDEGKTPTVNGIALDNLQVAPIHDELSIAAVEQMWPDDNPPKEIKRNFGTVFTFTFRQNGYQVTKNLYLVNNTMPVNFMFYGTPTEIMDMTYSQVTSCAAALVETDKNTPGEYGVYPTDYSIRASENVYLARDLDKDYPIPTSI